MSKEDVKYAIVAIDCFTKWIEAEPLATIIAKKIVISVIRNIITKYRIPHKIISNNGPNSKVKSSPSFVRRAA